MANVLRLILAALALAITPAPALAQTTTLTMSSWVSPQHHLTSVVLQGWATEVEKATNGRVKFTMLPKHPSAPPGTFDAVRDGLVDLSYVTASYTPARHILPLMAELPGAGDTALVNSVAYSRIYWKHFHKVGEYKGVKLLGVFTHGPGQMFTKKPVTGIDDVQGLKIRTGGGVAEAVAKALGASAFVKPAPESYELLKGGVADGVFFPMESIVSFKLETVLEQATLFPGGMYSSAFGFFMNEDKWNKLPKQDQDAITKLSGEHIARLAGRSWDEADKKGLEALKKSGVKIVNANAAFVAEVQKRSAPIVEDWIKKASAKGVDAAKILAEFRAELKKVAAGSDRAREWERRVEAVLGVAAALILLLMMLPHLRGRGRPLRVQPADRGAFEVTELLLLVLIFAGLPLVSYADEHALMDFIDRLLGPRGTVRLERLVQGVCAAIMFLLAWLVWLKADRIWAYRDATDVLRIVYGPFVYFMAVMIALTGVIHLYKMAARR